ncbi:MAG: hypothetical protein LC687_04985 [Actinobacteria bacterium]|nr:hypothetical protein [Actinomycetota bacterium]MCA1807189.1 hypothetical protein [Actinomycetota bacterium]
MSWSLVDGITSRLSFMGEGLLEDAEQSFEESAMQILDHAQAEAPWEDRSGTARDSLFTHVYQEGAEVYLQLAHGVEYGKWLELIQNGRFAIIMPTLEHFAMQVFEDAGGKITGAIGSDF